METYSYEIQITPQKSLEYITLNLTMDTWEINKKRQRKMESILTKIT
jgi:hypothetical protein